ncbi:MAG: hypothetical protein ACREHG_01795 [Candidatus Saccharimonadales bacterium]
MKAPFDLKGNLMSFPEPIYANERLNQPDWRDVGTFEETLEYVDYTRGRSSVNFIWRDVRSGREYPMFVTDLDSIMTNICVGRLRATWEIGKRGMNYGIRIAK